MSSPFKFTQGTVSYNTAYLAPDQPTPAVLKLKPGDINIYDFKATMIASGTDCSTGGHSRFEFTWIPGDGVTDEMTLEFKEVYDGAITGSASTLSVSPRTQSQPYGDVGILGGYDDGTSDPHTVTFIWRLFGTGVDMSVTSSYSQTIHNTCGPV